MKATILFLSLLFIIPCAMAQTETKTKTTTTTPSAAPSHECYMMKDGSLHHCLGAKTDVSRGDVTLTDGTTITSKGMITMPNGDSRTLANGECVAMNGVVGDCEKMHASLKKDEHQH